MTMAKPIRDAVAGLDAHESVFSLSPTSSFYPGFQVSPLNDQVFGLENYPLDMDDFQLFPVYPDHPWHGLGLADTDFTPGFDLPSYERPWEETMAPIEDSPVYQDTHSQFDYGSPSSLSLTHHVPPEVEFTMADDLGLTSDVSFAASLASLNASMYEPTAPWDSLCSQESPASSTFLSQPSPRSRINSVSTTPSSPSTFSILCSWEDCGKTFPTNAALNHHLKYHTKPFHCPHCPLQQATKRLLDRHINERHFNTEKYYCTVDGCSRSREGDSGNGSRHFPREENCRKHLKKMHGISWTREKPGAGMDKQVEEGRENELMDMDELTKRIRKERKSRKKTG